MAKRAYAKHDLVWFDWKGCRCVSPILAVNRATVRVVVSDGERLLLKSRVLEHDPAPKTKELR
jgi:hypothetical protein